jgi:hypothetical protein
MNFTILKGAGLRDIPVLVGFHLKSQAAANLYTCSALAMHCQQAFVYCSVCNDIITPVIREL